MTSDPSPAGRPIRFSQLGRDIRPPVIVDLMARALANPGLLSLAAGFTDNAVLPRRIVGEIASQLCEEAGGGETLQYGQNQGREGLRRHSCAMLAGHPGERADVFDPASVFITNGSQQALYLAVQVLCDRGDIVLVEEPSYFVCLEMLKGLGLRPVGIPCDETGAIRPDAFAQRLAELDAAGERERVKAVYLVSYFCNPSSRSIGTAEKEGIARILRDAGYLVPVIEDGAYRELYFDKPHEAPSILSLAAFDDFPRLYLGTYTKPFATGLKIGFGVCDEPLWLERMLCVKGHQDFGSAHFNQAIIERMLERGLYAEHLARIQKHYAAKAGVLDEVLRTGGLIEAGWRWEKPEGGMIFWLRGPEGADLRMESAFCKTCIEHGVLYVPGDLCFPGGKPWNCARLATGALETGRLRQAAGRFAEVARGL